MQFRPKHNYEAVAYQWEPEEIIVRVSYSSSGKNGLGELDHFFHVLVSSPKRGIMFTKKAVTCKGIGVEGTIKAEIGDEAFSALLWKETE